MLELIHVLELLLGLNETILVRHLAQCLAHIKYLVIVAIIYIIIISVITVLISIVIILIYKYKKLTL